MLYKSKVARVILKDHQNPSKCQFLRTAVDNLEIKFVSDRGLDHAVEREQHLKPVINLKNFLKSEPAKSLPISKIVGYNETLKIPFRPIEFIRKYPAVFEEFFPGDIRVHPHVRLTPEILDIDSEEQLIFDSETFRKNAADRLLKLLMLCRANEIPLRLIDIFKWDLGLPDNYVTSLVPEFPDYFQLKKGNKFDPVLELVCWSDDLSVSVMEKKAKKVDKDYEKGMPIEFPMTFSKGFEMDKKLKKWIDEWQKLPYLSPYENASHLPPNGVLTDRWAVAVLHELLHILGPKKTDRENILCLGDYLGVKPRLKRAIAHHPGIFYLSSKLRTYTVVLREGFRRGMLVERNPLMDMRGKYIHLMHTAKEKSEKEGGVDGSKQKVVKGGAEKENVDNGKEQEEKMQVSESDEDDSDDDEEDEEDEEVKEKVKGRAANGRRGSAEVNEDVEGSVGGRRERRAGKVNEGDQGRGRGGSRGGRGGFNKGNEDGRGRSGSIDGRRGFNLDGQERGGNRSERGGFNSGNGDRRERDGNRSERGGFNRGNGERQERGGNRSERGGFNRGNGERQERGGGEKRSERGGFKRGNEEGKESGGNRSGRRESGRFEEKRPRSGHGRGGGRVGIKDFGKV